MEAAFNAASIFFRRDARYQKIERTNRKVINDNSRIEAKTLLHLGCGAGGNDDTFKKYFKVTGVDISEGMLAIARRLNPEVRYLSGDMRNIQLKETFDAVAIPDSTIFENNYFCESQPTIYEATFAYLIRRKGSLEVFFDRHTSGLFPLAAWVSLLTDVGFEMEQEKMEHSYDRFMPGEGEYHLRVLACRKP